MTTSTFEWPPRVNLAALPTPLEPLRRMGERLGVDLWVKRDDMTGMELSGNKIRKLEFALAHARAQGADIVLTCGGAQSNHARATAIAATRCGLRSLLLLRTADPSNPPPPTGNILLDRMAGARIVWITPEEYRGREAVFARESARLRAQELSPYIIPEGASYPVGCWGYIAAMAELKEDCRRLGPDVTLITATGSGGTAAGLIMGAKLFHTGMRIVCINVCDDAETFRRIIADLCTATINAYNLPIHVDPQKDIEIIDGYVGRGYALSQPRELAAICDLARTEGIFLDPVYTGKAYFGMISELAARPDCFGQTIVFLHSGGLFGLFPASVDIEPHLSHAL